MEAIKTIQDQNIVSSGVTLWEEEGTVNFYFEENTIIDADLVF